MKMTAEEGYALLKAVLEEGQSGFVIDAVAHCLYDDYDDGPGGHDTRNELRELRPSIYEMLSEVKSLEDFEALLSRIKLENTR